MIKYILIAVLGSGNPVTHEFFTEKACETAKALVQNSYRGADGTTRTWADCITDERIENFSTQKNVKEESTPKSRRSDDLPIHESNDNLN